MLVHKLDICTFALKASSFVNMCLAHFSATQSTIKFRNSQAFGGIALAKSKNR